MQDAFYAFHDEASLLRPFAAAALRFFALLFCTLCLNACFGFFKLLTRMLDVLLVQLTHRGCRQDPRESRGFDTVQVTPARSIKT